MVNCGLFLNMGAYFCLRPKAKDLEITWVVVVLGFFIWSMLYQLLPPCYPFIFPSLCHFSLPSLSHTSLFLTPPSPSLSLTIYINTPTYVYLPSSTYHHIPNCINIPTYLCLSTNKYQPTIIYLPTYLFQSLNINIKSLQTREPELVLLFSFLSYYLNKKLIQSQ